VASITSTWASSEKESLLELRELLELLDEELSLLLAASASA